MLRPTSNSARIVADWLGPAPAASAADDVPLPEFKPRPERLGLGAKYVPHSAALSVAEQKFSKKLKAKPSSEASPAAAAKPPESSDDEEEGRSASIKSAKRKSSPIEPAGHHARKKKS